MPDDQRLDDSAANSDTTTLTGPAPEDFATAIEVLESLADDLIDRVFEGEGPGQAPRSI